MDDLEFQRERRRIADEALSTPNCPRCLTRMGATEDEWVCSACGEVSLG